MSGTITTSTGSASIQAHLWGRGARDWAKYSEPLGAALHEAVFDDIGIGPADKLLDIGCGAGSAAALAVERGVKVWGLDATPEMLEIARERVPNGTFQHGDMESLPYPDDMFDVVTGFNSFQYATNPINALIEARRVCRPGGSVVIAIWGRPVHCDSATVFKAIGSLLPQAQPGAPEPIALSDEGALATLTRAAGLEPLREGSVICHWDFPDLNTVLRSMLAAGMSTRIIEVAGLEQTRAAIAEAHARFLHPDGHYRMANEFIYLIARA